MTPQLGHSLHPYVSAHAAAALAANADRHWIEIDGSLAFFDISGFTPLTERLAALGRAGAEHINDVLNTVFSGLIDIVFEFAGDVLEFGGDAMVVLYTGDGHQRRAAMAAARMHRFMTRKGRIATPAGKVRLDMSCGMAAGSQAYYLLGSTRRAFIVAGPVSTEMARLEAAAGAGEVRVSGRLAASLPTEWVRADADGTMQLDLDRVVADPPRRAATDQSRATTIDTSMLLPVQFRDLADVGRRHGELKQVAMAFVRLEGTDDLLAEGGPEEVCRVLGDISYIVDHTAAGLDVCWLETQAEANSVRWTLVSGAPTATERDGERLLRVVRRIADASPRPLRIGANLGVVFVGDMGHPRRCTYIVMGDTTNLAARLMARAQPGEIIAGERLVRACDGRFATVDLEPFAVKGKQQPVRASRIGDLREPVAIDVGSGVAADESLLVGRERELAIVLDAVTAGGTIDIVGEAGVGKTRLWQEARRLRSDRAWWVARAELTERASAYLPFRRLIRQAAGIEPQLDPATAGMLLGAFVERTSPESLDWLPLIADVAGASVPATAAVDALDTAFRADRLRVVVTELVVQMTKPVTTIVFEDVHWLDEASQALLEVVMRTPSEHLSIVTTRRPGGWRPPAKVTVEVAPIGDELAEQLLLSELPPSVASDATLARLKESAGGNPLYLIELAHAVATESERGEFPESVERVLAARIDQLPTSDRALIRDVSVLGATVDRSLAADILDRPELTDPAIWERAFGDLFLIEGENVRFRHDLVRVAAYEGLAVRRRKSLHARAGEVIERLGPDAPLPDPVAALAYHASGSGVASRIVIWNRRAAEAAAAKGAMDIAQRLLGDVVKAEQQLRASRTDRGATYRQLAIAAERAGHPDAALDALVRASRLSASATRCELTVERSRMLEKLGRYRAALTLTGRALRNCRDPGVRGHLQLARATVHNFRGEWSECLTLTRALLADRSLASDERLVAQAHLLSLWCCVWLGLPDAAEHAAHAERLMIELDDSLALANLYLNRGIVAWNECRVTAAVDDFALSAGRYNRAGDVVGAALADNNRAEVLTFQFRLDEAEALLKRARRITEAANYPHGTLTTISGLSRIAAWRGEIDAALELQQEALRGFRELDADPLVLDSLLRLAEIHLLADDVDSAMRDLAEAEGLLRGLGEVKIVPATLARLRGRALAQTGSDDAARAEFEAALAVAEQDGFAYEAALAKIGIGRLDTDQHAIDLGMTMLGDLDVLAPPPGT